MQGNTSWHTALKLTVHGNEVPHLPHHIHLLPAYRLPKGFNAQGLHSLTVHRWYQGESKNLRLDGEVVCTRSLHAAGYTGVPDRPNNLVDIILACFGIA